MSMLSKLKTMISQTMQESWQKVNDSEIEKSINIEETIIENTPIVNNELDKNINIEVNCKDKTTSDSLNIEKDLKDNLSNTEDNNDIEEIIENIHLGQDISNENIDKIPTSITENMEKEIAINNEIKFVHTEGVQKVKSSKPFSTKIIHEDNIYEKIFQERPFFPKWNDLPSFIFEPYKNIEKQRRYGPFKEVEQISILQAIQNENKSPAKRVRLLLKRHIHRLVTDSFTLNLFLDKQECKLRFRLRYPLLLKIDRNRSLKEQIRYGQKTRYSPREQFVINGEVYLLTNDIFYYNANALETFFGYNLNEEDEFILSDLFIKYEPEKEKKKVKVSKYMGNNQDNGI